jgi:ferric-dicitrate binding protein FerR (iron transport regulator)
MSGSSCGRLWQAEAVMDRRLSAEDCASFERHAKGCSACGRELNELSRLKTLSEELPWPKSEPLQRRRARYELLRKAHGSSVGQVGSTRGAWRAALAIGLLCLVTVGLYAYLKAPAGDSPALTSPGFDLRPEAGSVWRQLSVGRAVRLQLERGGVLVTVRKLQEGQTFVIQLPDGELEVRGTRFTVEADGARTLRVAVEEGRVALRLVGSPELLLGAGQFWQRSLAEERHAAEAVGGSDANKPTPGASLSPVARPKPAAAPSTSASKPASASDFAAAMASYTRGDFATAEQLFQRFEALHPDNARVEDSLFLRAMTRHRRGDRAGAGQLAARYLERFPQGFRAEEARRLMSAQ